MKKQIFKLITKIFNKQINKLVQEKINKTSLKKRQTESQRNFPIGTKVIILGNEPSEELTVAEVIEFTSQTKEKIMTPVFFNEKKGKFLSMGIVHIWSQEKEDAFKKLTWDERFNVATNGFYHLSYKDIKRKNSQEYRGRMTS